MTNALALVLLALSAVNEFAWQLVPANTGMRGAVSYLAAWPVTAALCLLAASGWRRSRAIVAVCWVVAIQSFPTAACSGLWLLLRWTTSTGDESCSAYLGQWALLLSGSVALLVLWRWPRG